MEASYNVGDDIKWVKFIIGVYALWINLLRNYGSGIYYY